MLARIFARIASVWVCVSFFLLGLVFVVVGIIIVSQPKVEYQSVQGTVARIEEYYDQTGADDTPTLQYTVYVNYTVGGKTYKEADYGSYHTGMKVGDTVEVLYNPADPTQIQAPGADKIPYILIAVGAIVVVASAVTFVRRKPWLVIA